jgi:HKD family nuclease
MQTYECVSFPAEQGIIQVAQNARDRLFITVPYLNNYGVATILNHAHVTELWLLTNLDIKNITSASLDIGALLKLWDRLPLKVSSLGRLHAKVYIADEKVAMITSANLTRGGLKDNYEYGVILRDEQVVATILRDMTAYFNLGNIRLYSK